MGSGSGTHRLGLGRREPIASAHTDPGRARTATATGHRPPPTAGARRRRGPARAGAPPPDTRRAQPTTVRCFAASSGATMSIITPVPCSNPAALVTRGNTWTCQWYGPAWRCGAVWNTRL
jgi:hypothetical protein